MKIRMVGNEDTYIPYGSPFNELEGISFFIDNKKIKNPKVTFENKIKDENLVIYTLYSNDKEYKFKRNVYEVKGSPRFEGIYDISLNVDDVFDELYGVKAISCTGEDITDKIIVKGGKDINKNSTVLYSVTDNGITINATRNVEFKEYKVTLSPIPQNFSPICVKCDDNGILRQVGDINGNTQQSKIKEVFDVTEPCDTFFLKYNRVNNVKVYIDKFINKNFHIEDNKIILNEPVENTTVSISYKLINSFTVEYGEGGDYIDLKLNTEIKPNLIEVNYECNDETNNRPISHLSFNSIYNTEYSGFIYIDKKTYKEKTLKIHSTMKYLYAMINDRTNMYVELLDVNNNPLRNKEVNITCNNGSITKRASKTDLNGVIPFIYYAPDDLGDVIITATYNNITTSITLKIIERGL